MPQFDTFSFFSQLFWVFLLFSIFFISFSYFLLPALAIILKVRHRELSSTASHLIPTIWFDEDYFLKPFPQANNFALSRYTYHTNSNDCKNFLWFATKETVIKYFIFNQKIKVHNFILWKLVNVNNKLIKK